MKSNQRIFLIGLPGTGKSHFGEKLAEETGYSFYDLDDAIEEKEGRKISEIFEVEGEAYFRKVESETLHSFSEKDKFILATGGGSPCFYSGIEFMNEYGITVYLKEEKTVLIDRLSGESHRPLMQSDVGKKIDELLETRSQFYDQADISISHRNSKELISQLSVLKN
ncbi:MAG: shikimate kinase [Cyclobacteriaceae bacterium]